MSDDNSNVSIDESGLYVSNSDLSYEIQYPKTRKIDFSKVNELQDVINILEGLNITVTGEQHPKLEKYLTNDS